MSTAIKHKAAADATFSPTGKTNWEDEHNVELPQFSDAEVPSGTINGVNAAFTLANAPSPAASLMLMRNGILQTAAVDYNLVTNTITYVAGAIPQIGEAHVAWYRY